MIPAKQRRSILAILEQHGGHMPMMEDAEAPPGKLYVIDGVMRGPAKLINLARAIRDNSLVPETYSDEASTWA